MRKIFATKTPLCQWYIDEAWYKNEQREPYHIIVGSFVNVMFLLHKGRVKQSEYAEVTIWWCAVTRTIWPALATVNRAPITSSWKVNWWNISRAALGIGRLTAMLARIDTCARFKKRKLNTIMTTCIIVWRILALNTGWGGVRSGRRWKCSSRSIISTINRPGSRRNGRVYLMQCLKGCVHSFLQNPGGLV